MVEEAMLAFDSVQTSDAENCSEMLIATDFL